MSTGREEKGRSMTRPDWDEARARETLEKLKGKKLRRPNGKMVYILEAVEGLSYDPGRVGVRVKNLVTTKSYVLCHNVFTEEEWVEC